MAMPTTEAIPQGDKTPGKVLCIEPDEDIRKLLQIIMAQVSAAIQFTSSLEEISPKAMRDAEAILLDDPEDPADTQREIQTIQKQTDATIIITSDRINKGVNRNMIPSETSGRIDVIQKPFNIPELKKLVSEVIAETIAKRAAKPGKEKPAITKIAA